MSSSLTKPTQSLPDFIPLTSTTFINRNPRFHSASPTIILATWMNASSRNISFYASKHLSLNPSARIIILLGTVPNMIYRPNAAQMLDLQPAISAVLAAPESPVYIHLFSNSGAPQTALLLRAYKAKTGRAMPLKGLIMDSSVAKGTYGRAVGSLSYTFLPVRFPFALFRTLALLVIHLLVLFNWLLERVSEKPNTLNQIGLDLNDPELFSGKTRRVYLYGNGDRLVRWEDVEAHADEAKRVGWDVERMVFNGSEHCKWGKGEGEERYWELVMRVVGSEVDRLAGPKS